MGKQLDAFLNSISDHELAIYVGYQHPSFLKHTKESVRQEIETRGLSKNQLELYYRTKLADSENGLPRCARCGSNKFITDLDIERAGAKYGEYVMHVETNRCKLCHFNPSKVHEKNLWKRIKRFFFDPNKTTTNMGYQSWFDDMVR